jgi:hypothetical protein
MGATINNSQKLLMRPSSEHRLSSLEYHCWALIVLTMINRNDAASQQRNQTETYDNWYYQITYVVVIRLCMSWDNTQVSYGRLMRGKLIQVVAPQKGTTKVDRLRQSAKRINTPNWRRDSALECFEPLPLNKACAELRTRTFLHFSKRQTPGEKKKIEKMAERKGKAKGYLGKTPVLKSKECLTETS